MPESPTDPKAPTLATAADLQFAANEISVAGMLHPRGTGEAFDAEALAQRMFALAEVIDRLANDPALRDSLTAFAMALYSYPPKGVHRTMYNALRSLFPTLRETP